jgi:hypothetical protein
MKTTYTRVHVYLNKEEAKALDYLCKEMGETRSGVMKRGLIYYKDYFQKPKKDDKCKNR